MPKLNDLALRFDIGPDHGDVDIAVGLMQILIGIEGPPAGMSNAEFLTRLEAGAKTDHIAKFREAGLIMHKLICATVVAALTAASNDGDEPLRGAAARRRSARRPPRH